jgi:probable phosphoglycerate mutase
MRELLLVRHGQSEHHVRGITGGWTDLPLTAEGRRQAQATADRLRAMLPDTTVALHTSDLQRAMQTADRIARALGVDPVPSADLRELGNGAARDLSLEDAARIARPVTEPVLDWVPYEGAESWRDLHRRISEFLAELDREVEGTAVVVTHGVSLVCAVNWFLGIHEDALLARIHYAADPCSITWLRADPEGTRTLVVANDTSHLA